MLTNSEQTRFESVDIANDIQKTFGIKFTQEELDSKTFTVGAVYDLILAKLSFPEKRVCFKRSVFLDLRRQLLGQIPRQKLRPSARVAQLLAPSQASLVKGGFLATIPELNNHFRTTTAIRALLSILAIIGVYAAWEIHWSMLGATVVLCWVLHGLAKPWRVLRPDLTIRDIVLERMEMQFLDRAGAAVGFNPSEVWDVLAEIILRYLPVERERITRKARFVEDLNLQE